ncbi:MAG: gluconate 2-dehydrogenase subunit 3 family protein [Telluria sp.]
MDETYRGYDVLDKWNSESFDDKTRRVLRERLSNVPPRRFFTEREWQVCEALVARVLPQPDRAEPIPITPWIDAQLHTNLQEGFRYAHMPQQREAWRRGLAAIDDEARHRHDRGFPALGDAQADALLAEIERGHVNEALWHGLHPQWFFVTVLVKTVAGYYYSHPAAWSEIGFGGPASPRGYVRLGFDKRDPWEAKEVTWKK